MSTTVHKFTVTGALYIYNDPEGGTNQEFGVAPGPTHTFYVSPGGEKVYHVTDGAGQAHSFCDRGNGEVGIDLFVTGTDVPDRPGWAKVYINSALYESTAGTCGGPDNDGNQNSGWFLIAPGATEQRYMKVVNETEGGDYADITVNVAHEARTLDGF